MGTHRYYDWAFKERVVALSYERDNIKTLALELGVTAERIYKWCREFSEHGTAAAFDLRSSSFAPRQFKRV